jgi:hypothetical protein
MLCAEVEKAAGWEGAKGDDVVPSQIVETETNERRWHQPLVMMRLGTAALAPAALNKREAIGVGNALSRSVASRKRI